MPTRSLHPLPDVRKALGGNPQFVALRRLYLYNIIYIYMYMVPYRRVDSPPPPMVGPPPTLNPKP